MATLKNAMCPYFKNKFCYRFVLQLSYSGLAVCVTYGSGRSAYFCVAIRITSYNDGPLHALSWREERRCLICNVDWHTAVKKVDFWIFWIFNILRVQLIDTIDWKYTKVEKVVFFILMSYYAEMSFFK
jgi:hypothetical protein